MVRWSKQLEDNLKRSDVLGREENLMDSFFVSNVYEPQTEQEKKEFEEFSLIASAMALLIHVASSDKVIKDEEKQKIIDDLLYELEARKDEYDLLSKEFGVQDKEIINNLFDKLLDDYMKGNLGLEKTIEIVNKIYQKNAPKRNYLLRLCYHCAYSDKEINENEVRTVENIARQLNIDAEDKERIKKEARKEMLE